jgi:hypothetical protein
MTSVLESELAVRARELDWDVVRVRSVSAEHHQRVFVRTCRVSNNGAWVCVCVSVCVVVNFSIKKHQAHRPRC